jgi:hypothetical protein
MTDDQFKALQGQLLATQIAIRTMILTDPDRVTIANAISDELDRWANAGLYSTASEATLQGFAQARGRIFPSADDLLRVPSIRRR